MQMCGFKWYEIMPEATARTTKTTWVFTFNDK
jgi:hypothetical protein